MLTSWISHPGIFSFKKVIYFELSFVLDRVENTDDSPKFNLTRGVRDPNTQRVDEIFGKEVNIRGL